MSDAFPLLLLVGFFLIMWLLFIRPQQRRARELAHMQGSLEVGDEVMLTSGVYGVLHTLDDDGVHVEIAEGVVIRVARGAIGQLVTAVDEDATESDSDTTETTRTTAPTTSSSGTPTRDDDVPEEN